MPDALRRLAAIVVGDIAGYGTLMGRNEELTHRRVRAIERELIEPTIVEHRGQIVKTMGDGFLAIFDSPVEAVRCALVIQQNMTIRNQEVPKSDRIQYRIGINLGDVIIDSNDVFGEGVNIAARLEQMAEPSTVLVSGGIYEQVKYKLIAGYQSLGDRRVKHISEPVPIYRVLPDPIAFTRAERRQRFRTMAIAGAVLLTLCGAGGWFAWQGHVTQKLLGVTGWFWTPQALPEPQVAPAPPPAPQTQPQASAEPMPQPEQQVAIGAGINNSAKAPEQPAEPPVEAVKEPEMVEILGGTFLMGSNIDPSEQPIHAVTVKPFRLGRYPVTVQQWRACVVAHGCIDVNPETMITDPDTAPMTNLSWTDAQHYVAWLSAASGKTYRLPTEAEWEYAARAQSETPYWWGAHMVADVADCKGCGRPYNPRQPLPVTMLKPNPFGLFAMAGGVAQWIQDCWHQNYQGAPQDGSAWQEADCLEHVLRGGSWLNEVGDVRVAARDFYDTTVRYPGNGMRVARSD
jgi:formylglycine-generating enzyme required for sulfatase activity/class 3 adenylate cyclase